MCSSGFVKDANPINIVKSVNEKRRKLIGGLDKKGLGGRTFSETVGANTKESTLRKGDATYAPTTRRTPLAMGTQTGGTRQSLGK